MIQVTVQGYADWRASARALLESKVPPDRVLWKEAADAQEGLLATEEAPAKSNGHPAVRVPRRFVELAELAACHRDPKRWALLYRVLFRLSHGEPNLLKIEVDDDVRAATLMARTVGADIHRMHSFVRFRRVENESGEHFVAWYRPDHYIVERAAPFFANRFAAMRWAILTPDASVYWDLQRLRFGPGVPKSKAPSEDTLEDLWRAYYRSTFNPARANAKLLTAELPVRHWETLPEAQIVPELLVDADRRAAELAAAQPVSAAPFVPAGAALDQLRGAIGGCRGCDLYCHATQAVFGEGPGDARLVLIGEQPGDEEDRAGRPFVGPAGRLLDRALADAGLDRGALYVTNAVKHFKFLERGKQRLHQTPRGPEITACRPWLEAEIAAIKPERLVCLGGTAGQSVMGRAVRVLSERGRFVPHHWAKEAFITVHPSAILRARDPHQQERDYRMFVEDLKKLA